MNAQQCHTYNDGHSPSATIPHKGSLCKIHMHHKGSSASSSNFIYAITIVTCNTSSNIIDSIMIPSSIQKDNSEFPPSATSTDLLDMTHFNKIPLQSDHSHHQQEQPQPQNFELRFKQGHFIFMSDIFSILDTDSRGVVNKTQVREFVHLRCPVFQRRDRALEQYLFKQNKDGNAATKNSTSISDDGEEKENKKQSRLSRTTFEEVWNAAVGCSSSITTNSTDTDDQTRTRSLIPSSSLIGIEGWMVFSRFIALAQYQEAKRRFSSRHLQQTMFQKHERKEGGEVEIDGGGEGDNHGVVLVNVPPPESPAPITVRELVDYEKLADRNGECAAVPELDLDHSHVSAHDTTNIWKYRGGVNNGGGGTVKIEVFGTSNSITLNQLSTFPASSSEETGNLDFVVRFSPPLDESQPPISSESLAGGINIPESNVEDSKSIVVKRSFADLLWLHHVFTSQKQLGGTLCGRILPPFPSPIGNKCSDYHENSSSSLLPHGGCYNRDGTTTTPAIAVATASVGMISSAAKSAKSFLGGYLSSSTFSQGLPLGTNISNNKSSISTGYRYSLQRDGSFFDSSLSKANQIERYLNFLLEHPALSTSFPLNVILKASQSGLECAKRVLSNNAKYYEPNLDFSLAGHNDLPSNPTASVPDHSPSSGERNSHRQQSSSSHGQNSGNQSWIRTAAQAALALKLHGVLETTGCQSASAKLIDASLPNIYSSSLSSWTDFDNDDVIIMDNNNLKKYSNENKVDTVNEFECGSDGDIDAVKDMDELDSRVCEFEKGVVSIKSELKGEVVGEEGEVLDYCSDEYDMLPAPMSLSNTSALCAGSSSSFPKKQQGCVLSKRIDLEKIITHNEFSTNNSDRHHHQHKQQQQREYFYGGISDDNVVLGDVSVDKDINRLRDILRSMNDTLGMCLAATLQIGEGVRHRTRLHMNILGSLDSCEGIRGEIIIQRSLLEGVTNLEKGYNIFDASAMEFSRGLSWNKALASSAVHAAEDVHAAVKVSRRASRAKVAADAAAQKVQNEWNVAKFSTDEEARAAQTRVSNSQSQAIHAAVVEHEALTAKRRATMALAHDTKCWNMHRKREILRTCLKTAKAQRDASRHSITAWVQLRDGILDMSSFPEMTIQTRIDTSITTAEINPQSNLVLSESLKEDETNSLAMMMGCKSLDSLSEKKHVYDSEHDLFVDHFAAISNERCAEDSIMPKTIASMDLHNSQTQFMGVVEDTKSTCQDIFDKPAKAYTNPENETSLHSHSLLTMNPCTQPLSTMSDACACLDNEQLVFTQDETTHAESSIIEDQLNQILAPIGEQSSLQPMNNSTNPLRPLTTNGDDEEPNISPCASQEHRPTIKLFTEASRIEDQSLMLQVIDDYNGPPRPCILDSGDKHLASAQYANKKSLIESCMEENKETKAGSANVWNCIGDLTNPPPLSNVDGGDKKSTIAQPADEEPITELCTEGNVEFNAESENVWNDIPENTTNASLLDQNEAADSKHAVSNYYTEASDTISDILGVGESLDHEGGLIAKDSTTKEQDSNRLLSHRQRNGLTDSMQSLVDGLMLWGGQWDSEDDLSLPRGMAASLAMDESGILH